MRIDLADPIEFEVTYQGQTWKLTEPTLKQIEDFRDGGGANIKSFLVELGLPEDVTIKMPMSKVEALVTGITESLVKKK